MVPCVSYLKRKIRRNIEEFKQGRFKSIPQAIAVSYSEALKRYPLCKYLKRKN